MTLLEEINQQPEVLRGLLDRQYGAVEQIAAAIKQREIAYVYLAARGTSENAGIYGQYVLGAFNQLPVALAAPSLFTVYGRPPRLTRALVIGVSQSGQSPDIVAVIDEGKRQGALTLAITNDPASPLARAADLSLPISAGEERAVAATKTYSAQLMSFAMLSVALAGDTARRAELELIPEQVRQALALEGISAAAGRLQAMNHCVVLGRGYHFATALEWSLKLKELAYVIAERYSSAEFQHGPIALVEPGFPVLAVAPRDNDAETILALLRRLRTERGAELLVLSDDAELQAAGNLALTLPAGVPNWLMPIVSIGPAQCFCHELTLARGLDPDRPRGLSKITLTR